MTLLGETREKSKNHYKESNSEEGAEVVATFLVCVFRNMGVQAVKQRRRCGSLANAPLLPGSTSNHRYSQSVPSKPQFPPRGF